MSRVTYKGGAPVGPQRVKHKSMWWRFLLMWFAGVVSAVVIFGVTVAILGASFTVKEVGGMFGLDMSEFLQPGYQNMSILELATTLSTQKYETLGDIDKVTPAVKNLFVNEINPSLKNSVHYEFNWDEIKTKPFQLNPNSSRPEEEYDHTMDLVTYIPEALEKGVKIGNFFRDESTGEIAAEGILKYVVYPIIEDPDNPGKYIVNENCSEDELVSLYDIIEGGNNFFDNIKNAIVIGDVIDTSGSAFLEQISTWTLSEFTEEKIKSLQISSLVSGGGAFIEQIGEWTIADLTDENIKGLEIGLLFDDVSGNQLLETIKEQHWTINDLTDFNKVTALQLNQIIDTSESSDFMKELGQYTFNQIMAEGFVDSLELRKVFPDATGVLGALASKTYTDEEGTHYYTVGDLNNNDRILSLTIEEIFPDLEEGNILYTFRTDTLEEIGNKDINNILIKQIFPDYSSNSILNAIVTIKGEDVATIGDLTDQEVINSIPLSSVVNPGESKVLNSLINTYGATIGNLASKVELLTLTDVIDVGTDPTSMIYKIAHSEALSGVPITQIGANFSSLKISELFPVSEDSPYVLTSLANKGVTLGTLSQAMKDLEVRDVMKIEPGDIFKRSIGENQFEYYILTNEGWKKVSDDKLAEELEAYYNETTGYIVTNQAHEYIGTEVPTSIPEGAKVRDTLYSAGSTKINNSAEMIVALKNSLSLKDVVDINSESPQVLQSLKYTTLSEIPTVLTTLTLSQIVDIDPCSSTIMALLANVTVFGEGDNNLQHALENLSVIDLIGQDAYKQGEEASSRNGIKISFKPVASDLDENGDIIPDSDAGELASAIVTRSGKTDNYFVYDKNNNSYFYNYLYNSDEYTASHIDPAIKAAYSYVTNTAYSGSETYSETNNYMTVEAEGYEVRIEAIRRQKFDTLYWFMFTHYTNEQFSSEDSLYILKNGYTYTVNDMSNFTANFVSHIQNENLKMLHDAGLIGELPFDSVLKASFYGITNPYPNRTVGSLSLNELIDILNLILPLITTTPSA